MDIREAEHPVYVVEKLTTPSRFTVFALQPWTRSVMLTALTGLMLVTSSCGKEAGTPTTEATTTSTAVPSLTVQQTSELRVQAMRRAFSGSEPVCTSAEAPPELREAIATGFPSPVEYFDNRDDLKVGSTSDYRCVVIQALNVRNMQPGVIGIDVWVMLGDLNASAETYLFRWDGTRWIDSTPEETGVTVTTAVS